MEDKRKMEAAIATLERLGYTHSGGTEWRPPQGKKPNFELVDGLRFEIERLHLELSELQGSLKLALDIATDAIATREAYGKTAVFLKSQTERLRAAAKFFRDHAIDAVETDECGAWERHEAELTKVAP